jgi:hypothetical protein
VKYLAFIARWCKAHDTSFKFFGKICDEKRHVWDDDCEIQYVENVDLEDLKL